MLQVDIMRERDIEEALADERFARDAHGEEGNSWQLRIKNYELRMQCHPERSKAE